ncbi:MAG: hypothetical protein P1U86_19165 [Verrucomicrobiales bacterium]|nr:hypothetical protein [Verrucomicrobiales bacterium]
MNQGGLNDGQLTELIGMLERRLVVIGDAEMRESDPEGQLKELQAVSEAIMAFHEAHRDVMHNRLNHFLENCSFEKALAWARESRS